MNIRNRHSQESEEDKQKADAEAVERAQEEARVLDEAKTTPNVLNQSNYTQVVETTREAVKARDPDIVKENLAEGRIKPKTKSKK